jgi:hypothetical protein
MLVVWRLGGEVSEAKAIKVALLTYATKRSRFPPGVRVLIATKPIDFRKGADSLAALAKETLAQDPFAGAVLVFRSRRADGVRILIRMAAA